MIYLSDDYLNKYIDTFGYIFARSIKEGYSFSYIEKSISYSSMVEELERSNITTIAFSSSEKIYHDLLPLYSNNDFAYSPYDEFGWLGYIYVHLFLHFQITFELLFIILPIEKALSLYKIYHEMDISQTYAFFKESVKYSYLDNIMKAKKISINELSNASGISKSTINFLKYGKRDISKLETQKLFKISKALNVKMATLLNNLELEVSK